MKNKQNRCHPLNHFLRCTAIPHVVVKQTTRTGTRSRRQPNIRARPQYEQVTSSSTSKVVISNPTLPGPTGSDRDCTCTQHVRPRTTTSIGRASRAQAPRELFPPHACENCTYGNRIGRARRGAYVSPGPGPVPPQHARHGLATSFFHVGSATYRWHNPSITLTPSH